MPRLCRRPLANCLSLWLFFSLVANFTWAQSETATVSGQVVDPSGLNITGAQVKLVDIDRDTSTGVTTNNSGLYTFSSVQPGRYRMEVFATGFRIVNVTGLIVNVQDHIEQNFKLVVGSISESVTVEAEAMNVSGTVSTVVGRNFVANMPLNGRSLQDLILLTPGVITSTPQNTANAGYQGEFSVNGQRAESNYYTVDGVSANVGIAAGSPEAASTTGALPSGTALGTTQSLVSLDALEEFRVQSSSYSAEYGRTPGGQISFVTRSGKNQLHGTAFEYIRNGALDANNWFNGYYGLSEPALHQNDFGGTLGGPVAIPGLYKGKDKTFFFFSYEGLRLVQPQAASVNYVPDVALRQSAPTAVQQVLNAFPAPTPNAPDLGNGLGEFIGTWSNPSRVDSYSLRIDHSIHENLKLFFRFADTPSSSTTRGTGRGETASMNSPETFVARSYTLGAMKLLSGRVGNDFRLNYSSNANISFTALQSFAGAHAVDLALLQGINATTNPAYNVTLALPFGAQLPGISQSWTSGLQRQWNVVDTLDAPIGRHQFKFGVDYRRLSPAVVPSSPSASYYYFTESSVQANSVDEVFGQSQAAAYPVYSNFSAFVQDQWHVGPRLNLSMGLRWELNPAPGVARGNLPYTIQGAGDLATMTLAPEGTPLWRTSWYNFAPRLGASYAVRAIPGHETVLRGGGGVFFDTGQQLGSNGFMGPGFSANTLFGSLLGTPASFPSTLAKVFPPIINPPAPPYTTSLVFAFPPHLQLPFTLQWNISVEQALGSSQSVTASFVGAHAARLLEESQVTVGPLNPNFGTVFFNKNGLTSDYDSMQIQFQRKLNRGLQILASYTWAHSIDYGSFNFAVPYRRGNSDFDIRHNFSGALTYELRSTSVNKLADAFLHHWGFDGRFTARTGFPVNLLGNNTIVDPATGNTYDGGVDRVVGVPIYLYGSQCMAAYGNGLACPGGRAINPNAFAEPAAGESGNAARNFARGFGAWQMDLAIRREFPLHDRIKLQFRAEAFNISNHPSFGTIDSTFGDPTFGQALATLNSSLGTLSPLYQLGGPRSLQIALKVQF
jgi:Carboxypeptidase regulatory-like domain/TonB dependent receptor/TonB-dependent Receptor Plug Domain